MNTAFNWAACLVAVAGSFACGSGGAGAPNASTTPTERSSPTLVAGEFPPNLLVERFESFASLESSLGIDLPEPAGYQVATLVGQPPREPTKISARIAATNGRWFHLDFLLPPLWPNGPPGGAIRSSTVGGWSGEIITEDELGIEFAFECAEVNARPIWCVLNSPEVGYTEVEAFLSALR
jgi:hypothetical protein